MLAQRESHHILMFIVVQIWTENNQATQITCKTFLYCNISILIIISVFAASDGIKRDDQACELSYITLVYLRERDVNFIQSIMQFCANFKFSARFAPFQHSIVSHHHTHHSVIHRDKLTHFTGADCTGPVVHCFAEPRERRTDCKRGNLQTRKLQTTAAHDATHLLRQRSMVWYGIGTNIYLWLFNIGTIY